MRIRKRFNFALRILFCSGLAFWMRTSAHLRAADLEVRNFQLMSPGQAHLTVDTPADQTYSFPLSTNLPEWKPAGPLPPFSFDGQTATHLLEIDPEKPLATYQVEYQLIPPNPTPIAQLITPANEPVIQHLPDVGMPFEDEVTEVDLAEGFPISLTHVLVPFKDTTTVQSLNELLSTEHLSLAGTVPLMNLGALHLNEPGAVAEVSALVDRLSASGLTRRPSTLE